MPNLSSGGILKAPTKISRAFAVMLMGVVAASGVYIVAQSRAAANQLYLSPANGTVLINNTVDVGVRVDSGTDQVNAVQANLTYDPAKLEFVSISTAGTAFP